MPRYAIVIEQAAADYAAYVPDLPGCVATGATVEAVRDAIREAIDMHVTGMREDGDAIPPPRAIAEYAETDAA